MEKVVVTKEVIKKILDTGEDTAEDIREMSNLKNVRIYIK